MTNDELARTPRVQLLTFEGCPLAGKTRTVLETALVRAGLPAHAYESIDLLAPDTSKHLAQWGSPTILINGGDVAGNTTSDGPSCRIYPSPDRVPGIECLVKLLMAIHPG